MGDRKVIKSQKTGISQRVLGEIIDIARLCEVSKVVLFGSRARGDYREKSDIDLAIYGCEDMLEFREKIEETWTLLSFDLIDMSQKDLSLELKRNIENEGVVLYEQI